MVLEQRYKRLQWNLHPDKVTLRPATEREYSAQHAALVNHAYSMLRSPLARANYLLSMRGMQAGEGHEGTIDDPELLMEVMEAREEVDDTNDPQRLQAILQANRVRQQGIVDQMSAAFQAGDLHSASACTTRLTYLVKLEQEVVKKL